MSTTTIIFLRHADTEKNPSVNAALWELSEKGEGQAQEAAQIPLMKTVDVIYTSEEQKTALTAEPIAKMLDKEMHALAFFNEVRRGDTFLTKEEFEAEKVRQLTDLSYQAFGGESGLEALDRFKDGISKVTEQNKGATILIVTHGTVLNIYFAYLLNAYNTLPERWNKTAFCAYGIVEDGKVIKDII